MTGWSDEQVDELCRRLRDDTFRPWDEPSVEALESLTPEQAERVSAACDAMLVRDYDVRQFPRVVAAQGRGEATPGYPVFVFVPDVPDTPEGLLES